MNGEDRAYPEVDKARRMVSILNQALQTAYEYGSSEVRVTYLGNGPDAAVQIYETRLDIAQELGMSGAEAASLLRRLGSQGYIHLNYGQRGPRVDFGIVSLEHITDKGLALIGEMPNYEEQLIAGLDAIAAAIRERGDVPPRQKEAGVSAIEELKHFARGLPPGAAVEIFSRVLG